jgi:protein-tyrosine phosphatase
MLPKLLSLPRIIATSGISSVFTSKMINLNLTAQERDLGEEFVHTHQGPIDVSNWLIPNRVLMSAYPGDPNHTKAQQKISSILGCHITTWVCLQERRELKRFSPYWNMVLKENKHAQLIIFEIPDLGVTTDESIDTFTNELVQRFHDGENMVIHCWGGHGRTGTVCAILLGKLYHLTPEESLLRVQAVHDCRSGGKKSLCPQNSSQFQQVLRVLNRHFQKIR